MGVEPWIKCQQKILTLKIFGCRKILVFSSSALTQPQREKCANSFATTGADEYTNDDNDD